MAASSALGQDRFSREQGLAVVLIVLSVYLVEIADGGARGGDTATSPGPEKETR